MFIENEILEMNLTNQKHVVMVLMPQRKSKFEEKKQEWIRFSEGIIELLEKNGILPKTFNPSFIPSGKIS